MFGIRNGICSRQSETGHCRIMAKLTGRQLRKSRVELETGIRPGCNDQRHAGETETAYPEPSALIKTVLLILYKKASLNIQTGFFMLRLKRKALRPLLPYMSHTALFHTDFIDKDESRTSFSPMPCRQAVFRLRNEFHITCLYRSECQFMSIDSVLVVFRYGRI